MALYLRDALLDTALLPFPEDSKFDYPSLCEVANDIHLLDASTHDKDTKIHGPIPPKISLGTWTDIAKSRLGLSETQALVYFESFALILRSKVSPVSNNTKSDDGNHDSNSSNNNNNDDDSAASTAPSQPAVADSLPSSAAANPLHSAVLPSLEFVMLLFNQLNNRPFIRDPMLKGDEFPRATGQIQAQLARHPLAPQHLCKSQLLAKRISDDWESISSFADSPATPSSAIHEQHNHHQPSASTLSANASIQLPGSLACLVRESSSATLSSSTTQSRFPGHITALQQHLTNFWRSTNKQWLHLLYILQSGIHVDKLDARRVTTAYHHELSDHLMLNLDCLSTAFDFLFTTVGTRNQSVRNRLCKTFKQWRGDCLSGTCLTQQSSDKEAAVTNSAQHQSSMDLDGILDETLKEIPRASDDAEIDIESTDLPRSLSRCESNLTATDMIPDYMFCVEPAMNIFMDVCKGLPDVQELPQPAATVELVSKWIMWAVMERPQTMRMLKFTENGIAYGIEDPDPWLKDSHDPPQVSISRRRGQVIVVHAAFITGASVFIHRCHDAYIYILGPISTLFISRCRNTSVKVGAVARHITIVQCERLTLAAVCGQVVITKTGLDGHPGSDGIHAYVNTLARPLVCADSIALETSLEDAELVSALADAMETPVDHNAHGVVFAPCNAYYDGMLKDIHSAGLDLVPNQWDQPILAWNRIHAVSVQHSPSPSTHQHSNNASTCINSDGSANSITLLEPSIGLETGLGSNVPRIPISLLPASMFFLTPMPFEPIATVPSQSKHEHARSIERSALLSTLPLEYKTWLASLDPLIHTARSIMDAAVASRADARLKFQSAVEVEFQKWLKLSGRLPLLVGLITASEDWTKLAEVGSKWVGNSQTSSDASLVGDDGDGLGISKLSLNE